MADPQAMVIAVSALTAIKNMGMPEGLLPLSQAIVYVCEAEKSNSVYLAMAAAAEDAEKVKDDFVPTNLRNTPYMSPEQLKAKKPYLYPHDFGGYCEQQYMPDKLVGKKYYHPTDNGYEKTVKQIRKNKGIKD